jgi:hypothetical protein
VLFNTDVTAAWDRGEPARLISVTGTRASTLMTGLETEPVEVVRRTVPVDDAGHRKLLTQFGNPKSYQTIYRLGSIVLLYPDGGRRFGDTCLFYFAFLIFRL